MGATNLVRLFPDEMSPFDADRPEVLEHGYYEFILSKSWKGFVFRSAKLILTFRIITEGPYFGKHLYRCYNIKGLNKRGEIIPKGWHSDFVREYSALFGKPRRLREIGVRAFKNKILRGTVRTVEKDRKQRLLPDSLKYSVIDEFTEVVVG
jgi:hypothetical protein